MSEPLRTRIMADGSPTEELILTPQTDPAARAAIETYIEATDDEALATELQAWVDRCLDDDLRADGGIDITEVAASRRDVLATIAKLHEDRPPKGTEIAAHAGIDSNHIYHILNVLEDKQLIDRQTDPHDDRVSRATLTDAGVAVVQQLQHQYAGLDLAAVQSEPSTDESDNICTDGGTPVADCLSDDPVPIQSGLHPVDTDTPTVSIDGGPTIQVRPDHQDVPVVAAENSPVVESILTALTPAVTVLAARCSPLAESAADMGGEAQ